MRRFGGLIGVSTKAASTVLGAFKRNVAIAVSTVLCLTLLVTMMSTDLRAQTLTDGDCDAFLDVGGFHNVVDSHLINVLYPGITRTPTVLYLTTGRGRDNGEAGSRDPADIGIIVYGGRDFETVLNHVRLYGPIDRGQDSDGSEKYEWEDDCTMYYNSFAIADLTNHEYDCVRLIAKEGDHERHVPRGTGWLVHGLTGSALKDDIVFDGYVCLSNIPQNGMLTVVGSCDIPGRCFDLTFAVGHGYGGPLEGCFWDERTLAGQRIALLSEPCRSPRAHEPVVTIQTQNSTRQNMCKQPAGNRSYADDLPDY